MGRITPVLIIIPFLLLSACRNCNRVHSDKDVYSILETMRRDSDVLAFADSMGVLQIGPGTECLDPVKHTYSRDGRLFLYNEDWGGVLELPTGWIPEDDLLQAELSFHGTCVWSPDSTMLLSAHAGFVDPDSDLLFETCRSLARQGFTLSSHERTGLLIGDEPATCLSFMAHGKNGATCTGRIVILKDRSLGYSASLQYDGKADGEMVEILKRYVGKYPLGPEGQTPVGDCLQFSARL